MSKKRIFYVVCLLLLLIALAGGTWLIGTRIDTPAEAAARTAPPDPTPILDTVKLGVLQATETTRGTGRFGLPQPITLPPSVLKSSIGLITTLPKPEQEMKEGSVLLTASQRPVFVLQGSVPAYRDLTPGLTGDDVRQLEEALVRLGFDPGPPNGTYDRQTSAAVAEWYESAGQNPFEPTKAQRDALYALEQEYSLAAKATLAAEAGLETATAALESTRISVQLAEKKMQADTDAQTAAREKAKADLANATKALEAARATADHNLKTAQAALASTKADRIRLVAAPGGGEPLAVEAARAKAQLANKAATADVAAKISDRSVINVDPRQTRLARANAEAQVEAAQAASLNTRLEGELAIQAAERDARLADEQFRLAESAVKAAELEGALAVQQATDALLAAQRDLAAAESQLGLAQLTTKVSQLDWQIKLQTETSALKSAQFEASEAKKHSDRLAEQLETAKKAYGVQVPLDEIVFLPELPVRVEEVKAVVGGEAKGEVMTVTDFHPEVEFVLDIDYIPYVQVGTQVELEDPDFGIEAKGEIKFIAAAPGTRGANAYQHYCEISVTETNVPLNRRSVKISIPLDTTGEPVLQVPVRALSQVADGSSRVQVKRGDKWEYVTVNPGLAAAGMVEVTPAVEGKLKEGDEVVVGYEFPDQFDSMGP